jgi:hypothetical protein
LIRSPVCVATPLQLSRTFNAKENHMSHLTLVLMIVGAFVLVLGIVIDVRAHLENRAEELAPFRNYFGAEYDRDLLRQSSWSDGENPSGRRSRYEDFNVSDCGATDPYSRGGGSVQRNRDED